MVRSGNLTDKKFGLPIRFVFKIDNKSISYIQRVETLIEEIAL